MQRGLDRPHPLWAIPLAAGLLPAVAVFVALHLSVRQEFIPACNPFFEGCVSISAAARHGLPNHIFRALVVPAAALQGLTWMLCSGWLRSVEAAGGRQVRALPWLGMFAALFLVLYGTFLGTEGQAYRWMRHYGVVFYFGLTCICMVISAGHLFRLAGPASIPLPMRFERVLVGLCMVLVGLGLASAFSPLYAPDDRTRDRIGNALEWNGALIFTLFFLSLAWLWHATGFSAKLTAERH
ncbi:MAG: hypothetical protein ABI409_06900 [Ramlibacter sp.]